MKKLITTFMLMFVLSLCIFASSNHNPVSKSILINGYYEEEESNLIFKIWKQGIVDESGRIYHAGDIYLDGVDPTTSEVRIFTWELSGNKNLTVNLSFTITPLQAFSNGTYYIPKHTLRMYEGNALSYTHNFSTTSHGSSSYPGYRQSSSGAGSFIILSAVFAFNNVTITAQASKTGFCTLQVLEYEEDTAGNFDYVSYVTVEFSSV